MISYETHQKIVSDALRDLLLDEFDCDVILAPAFDSTRLTKGEYIRYWFIPSNLVNSVHDGEYRTYNIDLYYYFDVHRKRLENVMDNLTSRADRLKQLMIDNVSYSPGNYYMWHYLGVGDIDIESIAALEDVENAEDVMVIKCELQITRGNF